MKHKFTVFIEADDEDRGCVKDQLEGWLELNTGEDKTLLGCPDWDSIEVTD